MSTNAKGGYAGLVKLGANTIAEWTKASIKADKDEIEVTSKDSGLWKEFLQGHKSWTFDLEMNFYIGDTTGQKAIVDSYINDTLLTTLTIASDTGVAVFAGSCFVKSLNADLPLKDGQKLTVTFRGTAALSYT